MESRLGNFKASYYDLRSVVAYAASKLPHTISLMIEILERVESVITALDIPCTSSLVSDFSKGEVS